MRPDDNGDIDISGRTAVSTCITLPPERNCLTVVNTGRNLDINLVLLADISGTAARFAGLMNNLAFSAAARALPDRLGHAERRTLLRHLLPAAMTVRTHLRRCARFTA